MTDEFIGTGLPLDQQGLSEAMDRIGIGAAEIWAILNIETCGCGFLADRRPVILFERHIFSRETNQRFDGSHPNISNQQRGGYGAGGAAQYERLSSALALDREAALRSTSWGIGQVMGFNAKVVGYSNVDEMITAMKASEDAQLIATVDEIKSNELDRALRSHDWTRFACGYNGSAYREHAYDTRLADAYQKYAQGPLPDVFVRAAQIYLTYLGYNPGPIDSVFGRFTRSALNKFQAQFNLPISDEIDEGLLSRLKQQALNNE